MDKSTKSENSELSDDPIYRRILGIARLMDKRYLDPIFGFFLPGIGDALTSVMVVPFLYYSLFKLKSIPLTLAVLCNAMLDMLMGMIPYFIGDILDVWYRSYSKSCRLITGFVENDEAVIREVNRRAWLMVLFLILLSLMLYGLFRLLYVFLHGGYEWLSAFWA